MTHQKPSKTKIEKSISSMIVIIAVLSSILAGSVISEKSITANAIKKYSIKSKIEKVQIKSVDDIKELSQLNEGWYKISNGFVYYLETFNSYAPLNIKIKNPKQQNGFVVVDSDGSIKFSESLNGLAEEGI